MQGEDKMMKAAKRENKNWELLKSIKNKKQVEILCDELQNKVGAKFTVNENPQELAQIIISDMEKKRVSFEQLVEEKMNANLKKVLMCVLSGVLTVGAQTSVILK